MADTAAAVEWLLAADEPAIRYRARTWLLGQPETAQAVRADRRAIADGPPPPGCRPRAASAREHDPRPVTGGHVRIGWFGYLQANLSNITFRPVTVGGAVEKSIVSAVM